MYQGGAFKFSFNINTNYPHEPPKVKCTQTVRVRSDKVA
jgi:ubiquitin-conjugating enzyme E2 M